jgi:spermidine synthase
LPYILLFAVFVVATCGLIYELICSTAASYLLGDSVTQFSTVIGVYLFSMGIGSFLSKYISRNLIAVFIQVEILIGFIGGCSASILFLSFEYVESFRIILYSIVSLTGILVGLEIPLLMRILKDNFEFSDLVSKVFTFDYAGALIASILFPLFLVPHLGLIRSAFMFGILNISVAIWTLYLFKKNLSTFNYLNMFSILGLIGLVFGFVYSENLMSFAEASNYPDKVIYSKSTKYQRITLTSSGEDLRLFLNGNLQFSSRDEYRYHEALVHIGLASIHKPKDVLILGGGDGLAVREILKYPSIKSITLVDLDSSMTQLFKSHPILKKLNNNSLNSAKVKLISADAFIWLRNIQNKKETPTNSNLPTLNSRRGGSKERIDEYSQFDFIVVDFPDPSNFSLGKLYTNAFYNLLKKSLKPNGVIVVQSTSPYYAKKSYWCVVNTLASVGLMTTPYHAYIPSFGDWGYVLATHESFQPAIQYPTGLRFVNAETVNNMLSFPDDMKVKSKCINKLNNQILVHLFEEEWAGYVQAH